MICSIATETSTSRRARRRILPIVFLVSGFAGPLRAQEGGPSGLGVNWTMGPGAGNLGGFAEIRIPEGYQFAGPSDARRLLEAMQNPTNGSEMGLLSPRTGGWFLVFEFSSVGYVKDDEKDKLDAGALLGTLRTGNEAGNKERRKRGWSEITLIGWEQVPRYNVQTHNLEWATRSRSVEGLVVNHNTRLLGRRGVMEVTLVCGPEEFSSALPHLGEVLEGYSFKPGQTYAEFRRGDRVAAYGLTALVAGGAAVALAKSGLLAKLWKLLVIGVVAVTGFVRRLFKGKSLSEASG